MKILSVRHFTDISNPKCQVLVMHKNQMFLVCSLGKSRHGFDPEVLVFPADNHGEIASFIEVCGGKGVTITEAIDMLEKKLA